MRQATSKRNSYDPFGGVVHDPGNTEKLRQKLEAASGAPASSKRRRKGTGEAGQPHRRQPAAGGTSSKKSVVARALDSNHNSVHGPPIPVGSGDLAKAEARRRVDPGQHLLRKFLDGRRGS